MNARAEAARILAPVLAGKASLEIPERLADHRDRALIAELCYGTLRRAPRLQAVASQLLNKPLRSKDQDIQALVLIGLYQLEYLRTADHAAISETVQAAKQLKKNWASGLINASLRRWQREREQLLPGLEQQHAFAWSCPDWMLARLREDWPLHWQQVLEASNQQAPMTLRVNLSRVSRETLASRLNDSEIACEPGDMAETALRLERPVGLDKLNAFREGLCSIQDEAAQLCAPMLQAETGHRVLDACAAPGGKTGHLLEAADCELTALDISPDRLQKVEENLERLQLQAGLISADAADTASWWDGRPFQRILLDAPCSGSGVMSRHPDIKLLRTAADVHGFAKRQLKLLASLWQLLEPGGQLLYVTCSVFREENEAVVATFLQQQPAAQEITPSASYLQDCKAGKQLLPIAGRHDGFYYALMRKQISG